MRKLTLLSCKTSISNWKYIPVLLLLSFFSTLTLSSQNVLIETTIISRPDAPTMVDDSVCVSVKVTNLTSDTIKNLHISLIDPLVQLTLASDFLFPNTASGSFTTTGSGCFKISAMEAGAPFVVRTISGSGSICPTGGGMTTFTGDGLQSLPIIFGKGHHVCVGTVNISVDENCTFVPTPDMFLDTLKYPVEAYKIIIKDESGTILDNDAIVLKGDDFGKKYTYEISTPLSPNITGCWGYVNFEYYLNPEIYCKSDTLSCFDFANFILDDPDILTLCTEPIIHRGPELREDLCGVRGKDGLLARVVAQYRIEDEFGNFSDTCTQEIYIRETIVDSLVKDTLFTLPKPNVTLQCGADLFNDKGQLKFSLTGGPMYRGRLLSDYNEIGCNFYVDFEDEILDTITRCNQIYRRTWLIHEWRCNAGYKVHKYSTFINIIDTIAPELAAPADSIYRTVTEFDCTAAVNFLPATVSDCQGNTSPNLVVEIRSEFGSINQNGGLLYLPIGRHVVYYIATDLCGNSSRDSTIVQVVDQTRPVAICGDVNVINLSQNQAFVTALQLDEASYDECGPIVKRCVVRMDDRAVFDAADEADGNKNNEVLYASIKDKFACGRDFSNKTHVRGGKIYLHRDSLCMPTVEFCCMDAGKEIPVFLRVYDASGLYGECMVMVSVSDKDPATIVGPADVEISCDFAFADSSIFGTIRAFGDQQPFAVPREFVKDSSGALVDGYYIDNCGLNIVELPVQRTFNTLCGGIGMLVRTFQAYDEAGNLIQTLTQKITITGDEATNPVEVLSFPADQTIMSCPTADAISSDLLGTPVLIDKGCSLVGIGYEDSFFETTTPGSRTCMKILREWHAIDWCRDPLAENIILIDTQYIFVMDNVAPVFNMERDTIKQSFAAVPAGIYNILLTAKASDCVSKKQLVWSYTLRRSSNNQVLFSGNSISNNKLLNQNGDPQVTLGLARGLYNITWTATDKCGNTSSFRVVIAVNVNGQADVCPTCPSGVTVDENVVQSAFIEGQVLVANGEEMDNVEVHLMDTNISSDNMVQTDLSGEYAFGDMSIGGKYVIDPKKVDGVLNGVSTLDMILMQKHVLGLQTLVDPISLIAADVNNDGQISAFDLVEMRSVILGKKATFTNNDSWRFIWEGQDIAQAVANDETLIESYIIDALENDMVIDFTGIKVGDVTGDSKGNSASARGRSLTNKILSMSNRGASVSFSIQDQREITGLQVELSLGELADKVVTLQSDKMSLNVQDWYVDHENDKLVISWYSSASVSIQGSESLFSILLSEADLSTESISIDESRINAESYNSTFEVNQLTLENEQSIASMSLSQNSPNPWSDFTIFQLNTPIRSEGVVRIFDISNRLISERKQNFSKGINSIRVTSDDIRENGVFFIEVESSGMQLRQKMLRVN